MKERKPYLSIFEEDIKNRHEVMKQITEVFKENSINFCFIGGIILNEFGYYRTTDDIDTLIAAEDRPKVKELLINKHVIWNGERYLWKEFNIFFDMIFSGQKMKGGPYPNPKEILVIKNGIPVMNLGSLIEHKIKTGSEKFERQYHDYDDVIKLIAANHLQRNFYKNNFNNQELKDIYLHLWALAKKKQKYNLI